MTPSDTRRKRARDLRAAGGTKRQVMARKAGIARRAAEKTGRAYAGYDALPTDPQVGDMIVYQRVRDGQLQQQTYQVASVKRDPFHSGRLEIATAGADYEGNGLGPTFVGRQANAFVARARAGGYEPGSGLVTVIAATPEAAAVMAFVDQYRKDLLEAGVVVAGPAAESQVVTAQRAIEVSLARKNAAKNRCLEFAVKNGLFCMSDGRAMLVVPSALRGRIAAIVGGVGSK